MRNAGKGFGRGIGDRNTTEEEYNITQTPITSTKH
jgi:hypothetical protein